MNLNVLSCYSASQEFVFLTLMILRQCIALSPEASMLAS